MFSLKDPFIPFIQVMKRTQVVLPQFPSLVILGCDSCQCGNCQCGK